MSGAAFKAVVPCHEQGWWVRFPCAPANFLYWVHLDRNGEHRICPMDPLRNFSRRGRKSCGVLATANAAQWQNHYKYAVRGQARIPEYSFTKKSRRGHIADNYQINRRNCPDRFIVNLFVTRSRTGSPGQRFFSDRLAGGSARGKIGVFPRIAKLLS